MERKIGDKFKLGNMKLEVMDSHGDFMCPSCAFWEKNCNIRELSPCSGRTRSDGKNVYFKEV